MSDDDDKPARLSTTKPPPDGAGVHEEMTVIGKPPEDILAMVRSESHADAEKESGAPTARPPVHREDAPTGDRTSTSVSWPPIATITLVFVIIVVVLALLTR